MTERQFDHIEKKIKEAAEYIQPEFNDQAWDCMEKLLDGEKRKKRPVFWWWISSLILIILPTIYYFIMTISVKNETSNKNTVRISAQSNMIKGGDSIFQKPNNVFLSFKGKLVVNEEVEKRIATGSRKEKKMTPSKLDKNDSLINSAGIGKEESEEVATFYNKISLPEIISMLPVSSKIQIIKAGLPASSNNIDRFTKVELNKIPVGDILKNRNSFHSKFYIKVTGGIDVPGLNVFSNSGSKISEKFGVGLGYHIHKKLSLETGFYQAPKKYFAGPENYNYPDDSYWNTVKLIRVDADCFIYEIPLKLQYDFFLKKSLILYGSSGFESFIMKREDYRYDYIKNGNRYNSSASFKGNFHLFSSVQFSIGLEKQINQTLSVVVSPSTSIPISGVGTGKVKLYNSSLQAGIKYFPFKRK